MLATGDSLWGMTVRRIRSCNTMFAQNVKLSLRQTDEEQLSRLPLPHALVVPTQDRAPPAVVVEEFSTIVVPRVVTIFGLFDARGSDQEYLAAADIEQARYELLECLLGWKPFERYMATGYTGMRLLAVKAPMVRVSFVFTFNEQIDFSCEPEPGCPEEPFTLYPIIVTPIPECPPECEPIS